MLDQYSRNIYRNSPIPLVLADPQARIVARYAFENGYEDKLEPLQRVWLYMVRINILLPTPSSHEKKKSVNHHHRLCQPLEHSEDKVDQALSVVKFQQLAEESDQVSKTRLDVSIECHSSRITLVQWSSHQTNKEMFETFAKFARDHKGVIDRFGRYPHRNKILDRKNTPEEEEFLKEHEGW